MFRIDPSTLYTRADLERELEGIQSVETFLDPLELDGRLYKKAWQGQELLDAMQVARERIRRAGTIALPRPRGTICAARHVATLERVPRPTK
jgi:hypothetical protein